MFQNIGDLKLRTRLGEIWEALLMYNADIIFLKKIAVKLNDQKAQTSFHGKDVEKDERIDWLICCSLFLTFVLLHSGCFKIFSAKINSVTILIKNRFVIAIERVYLFDKVVSTCG